jgi:hypothetical protein
MPSPFSVSMTTVEASACLSRGSHATAADETSFDAMTVIAESIAPRVVGVRWTPLRVRALRHALWIAVGLFTIYVVGILMSVGLGLDSHAYWAVWRNGLYTAAPEQRDAYLYSPAFAQALWPLTLLPWPVFCGLWMLMSTAAYAWLLAPLGTRWAFPLLLVCVQEIVTGNVWSLFALVIVLGFRFPALWAFPLLLKVTPGIGVLWFAVRREWRRLAVAIGTTFAVAGISIAVAPHLWTRWLQLLFHPQRFSNGSRAVLQPILHLPTAVHLVVGLSVAIPLVIRAARTDRPQLLPVAILFACPVWGLNAFGVLTAIPRLALDAQSSDASASESSKSVAITRSASSSCEAA